MRPYEVSLFYEEISHNIGKLFLNWIDKQNINQSVLGFYFQAAYLKFPSEEQLFLNIVFALETLHRSLFDFKTFSDEAILRFKKEKKQALKEIFSEEFKIKIEASLGNFSSPSFSQRLKSLIDHSLPIVREYMSDVDAFTKAVAQQRNYLAHNHQQTNSNILPPYDYLYFTSILKLIFECAFLQKIGFEENQINTIIKRNFVYQQQKIRRANAANP